jgi:E3 Ubiquitin ligase.
MTEFFCPDCIAAMPAAKFWIVFALASGFAIAALLSARANFIKSRLIEDMPTSLIRSASQGYVELVGLAALHGDALSAPLTGKPCLWWRYKIERHQKSGKSSSWKTIEKGASTSSFYMDDGSGVCRIDPAGADISCLHKKVWYGHSRTPPTATIKAPKPSLLNRLQPLMGAGRYRYTEFLIREGDPLYLLGHFVSDASGRRTLTLDQVAGQVIREWKKDFDNLLVRFDSDGNGRLDEKEWSLVQQAAQGEAFKLRGERAFEAPEHSVTKPEDRSLPYLIGSHGQEALSRKFRWWALASAAAFIAAGAFATWLSSSRF